MTVQNTNSKNIYIGNDVTTVFPYTFQIAARHINYIKVYIETNGINAETDNFIIDAEAKTVTYPKSGKPLTVGEKITIKRKVPLVQMLNLVNQGPYFAEDIEVALDEIVMMCQELSEEFGRTFGLPVSIDAENIDGTLPFEPGKSFAWRKDGKGFELTENPADVLPAVNAEVNSLREFVVQKTIEIQELVTSLNSLTREELTKLRNECAEFAYKSEQSALANTRWPVSDIRVRPSWKNNFDIEGKDLFLTVPEVVKINVEE